MREKPHFDPPKDFNEMAICVALLQERVEGLKDSVAELKRNMGLVAMAIVLAFLGALAKLVWK